MVNLCQELEKCLTMWLAPARDTEEKAYTLMSDTASSKPDSPDGWMLTDCMHSVAEPGLGATALPSIPLILKAENRCRIMRKTRSGKAYFMRFGRPEPISSETVENMHKQLREKNVDRLAGILRQRHVLIQSETEGEGEKVDIDKLRFYWCDHVAVFFRPDQASARCTCWHFCRRGHCPHAWAVMVWEGLLPPQTLPTHAAAGTAIEEEGRKRKKNRSESPGRTPKKRPKRPQPEQADLAEIPVAERAHNWPAMRSPSPDPDFVPNPETPRARQLSPQRLANSPMNRGFRRWPPYL